MKWAVDTKCWYTTTWHGSEFMCQRSPCASEMHHYTHQLMSCLWSLKWILELHSVEVWALGLITVTFKTKWVLSKAAHNLSTKQIKTHFTTSTRLDAIINPFAKWILVIWTYLYDFPSPAVRGRRKQACPPHLFLSIMESKCWGKSYTSMELLKLASIFNCPEGMKSQDN